MKNTSINSLYKNSNQYEGQSLPSSPRNESQSKGMDVIKSKLQEKKCRIEQYEQSIAEMEQMSKASKVFRDSCKQKVSFRLMDCKQRRVRIPIDNLKQIGQTEQQQLYYRTRETTAYQDTNACFFFKALPTYLYYPPNCSCFDITYCKNNGSLYVFGGISCTSLLPEGISPYFYTLNPEYGTWSKVISNSMYNPMPRYGHTLVCLGNELLLFGGVSEYKQKLRDRCFYGDLWAYNTLRNSWKIIEFSGQVLGNRKNHAACVYNKYLIIYGGLDQNGSAIAEISWTSFEEKKSRWKNKKMEARFNHKMEICDNHSYQTKDCLFVYGGRNQESELIGEIVIYPICIYENELMIREPSRLSFTLQPREHPIMCSIGHGILILGGIDTDNQPVSNGWFYDVDKKCIEAVDSDIDWHELRGAKGAGRNGKDVYIMSGITSKKYKAIQVYKKDI